MRRRDFIRFAGVVAAWPLAAHAQQRFRIGLLETGAGGANSFFIGPFTRKLNELGYVEGKNLVIERRAAEGKVERLADLAADLVRLRVDVIVTVGTPAGFAAKQATSTIPIVLGTNSDPVGVGLVASLARPGGNITGNSFMAPDLSAKRLDMLRRLDPRISRFAILWDSSNPGMAQRVRETEIAADQSHVFLYTVGPRTLEELEAAFADLLKQHSDALLITTEAFARRYQARILDFANGNKISGDVRGQLICRGGRADVLWARLPGGVSHSGRLRRQDPQACQAGRFADRAADNVRAGAQPEDSEGHRA